MAGESHFLMNNKKLYFRSDIWITENVWCRAIWYEYILWHICGMGSRGLIIFEWSELIVLLQMETLKLVEYAVFYQIKIKVVFEYRSLKLHCLMCSSITRSSCVFFVTMKYLYEDKGLGVAKFPWNKV